jgi:hypothetical protein
MLFSSEFKPLSYIQEGHINRFNRVLKKYFPHIVYWKWVNEDVGRPHVPFLMLNQRNMGVSTLSTAMGWNEPLKIFFLLSVAHS